MQVRALRTGYCNERRYKEGEIFEMPDHIAHAKKDSDGNVKLPRWVEPVDGNEEAKPAKEFAIPGMNVKHQKAGKHALHDKKSNKKSSEQADVPTGDSDVI